jgi:adenylate cyclase class 2
MAREEELKFSVPSLQWARQKLSACGAQSQREACLEENWVLDDAKESLRMRGCLLRVRRWGQEQKITFKGPAHFAQGVKSREEVEVAVASAQEALQLLACLGFAVKFRYQKLREEYRLGKVVVALDQTPMGCFLELEGPREDILLLASQLELAVEQALSQSYLELWRQFRQLHPEQGEDMLLPLQE